MFWYLEFHFLTLDAQGTIFKISFFIDRLEQVCELKFYKRQMKIYCKSYILASHCQFKFCGPLNDFDWRYVLNVYSVKAARLVIFVDSCKLKQTTNFCELHIWGKRNVWIGIYNSSQLKTLLWFIYLLVRSSTNIFAEGRKAH